MEYLVTCSIERYDARFMEQRTAEMYAAFITNNPEAGTLFAIVSYGGSMLSKYSHGVRLPESKPR